MCLHVAGRTSPSYLNLKKCINVLLYGNSTMPYKK